MTKLDFDEGAHRALLNGEELKLTAAEWKILVFLSSSGNAVVSPEQILDQCLNTPSTVMTELWIPT